MTFKPGAYKKCLRLEYLYATNMLNIKFSVFLLDYISRRGGEEKIEQTSNFINYVKLKNH